jgi:hypothetical protein
MSAGNVNCTREFYLELLRFTPFNQGKVCDVVV